MAEFVQSLSKLGQGGFIFKGPNVFSRVNVLYADLVTSFFWQEDEGDNLLSSALYAM